MIIVLIVIAVFLFLKTGYSKKYSVFENSVFFRATSQLQLIDKSEKFATYFYPKANVKVSVITVNDNFWSSGDIDSRMDEYVRVLSASNYGSGFENVKLETVEGKENALGKIKLDIVKKSGRESVVAVVASGEYKNRVIEFTGEAEDIKQNEEWIDQVIQTIEIEKKTDEAESAKSGE